MKIWKYYIGNNIWCTSSNTGLNSGNDKFTIDDLRIYYTKNVMEQIGPNTFIINRSFLQRLMIYRVFEEESK